MSSTCIGLFAMVLMSSATSALAGLERVPQFAIGGIYYEGRMSDGERALRAILQQKDPSSKLEAIALHGSSAGQLYALLGLRTCDRPAYQQALEHLRGNKSAVDVIRGCSSLRESFQDLIKEIDEGKYDRQLRQPPW